MVLFHRFLCSLFPAIYLLHPETGSDSGSKFLARAFCKWWYVLPLGRRLSLLIVGKAEIIDDHYLVH